MAESTADRQEKITDCPMCGLLCLEPTIMPCGHYLCRRCLRERLQQKGIDAHCQFCSLPVFPHQDIEDLENEPLDDPDALLEGFQTDVILDDLVKNVRISCNVCSADTASAVCLDCRKYFCWSCQEHHNEQEEFQNHRWQMLGCASLKREGATTTASPMSNEGPSSSLHNSETGSNSGISRGLDQELGEDRHAIRTDDVAWGPLSALQRDSRADFTRLNRCLAEAVGDIYYLDHEVECSSQSLVQLINFLFNEVLRIKDGQASQDQHTQNLLENLRRQQQVLNMYLSRLDDPSCISKASNRKLGLRLTRVKTDSRELQIVANAKKKQLEKRLALVQNLQTDICGLLDSLDREAQTTPDLNTCVPQPVFKVIPCAPTDLSKPFCEISSMVATQDGRLVMADRINESLKVLFLSKPSDIVNIKLSRKPLRLCVLSDGQVAVTTEGNRILFVDIEQRTFSSVATERQYWGVSVLAEDNLVVTCRDAAHTVDVVTRDGTLLRTVTLSGLSASGASNGFHHVHATRAGHILLSNYFQHTVYRADLATGELLETLTDPDLQQPYQVTEDDHGNVYVASWGNRCLLVRLARMGAWRRLLDHSVVSDETYDRPAAVAWCGSELAVAWDKLSPQCTMVACYKLI